MDDVFLKADKFLVKTKKKKKKVKRAQVVKILMICPIKVIYMNWFTPPKAPLF